MTFMSDCIFSILDNYKDDLHENLIVRRVNYSNGVLKFIIHSNKNNCGVCYNHKFNQKDLSFLLANERLAIYINNILSQYCDLAYFYLNFIDGYDDEKHGKYLETYLKLCKYLRKRNKR